MNILIFVLIVLVAALAYMLRRAIYLHRSAEAYIVHISEVSDARRVRLAALMDVLARSGGGLAKRLSEHAEIENAIRENGGTLLAIEPGLTYWLNANGQFFGALRDVLEDAAPNTSFQSAYGSDTAEDAARMIANSNIAYMPKR